MKENSIEEDFKMVENFITYFNKNIQNGNMADLTVLGEEIDAIKALLSNNKKLKRALALISETCIDVSKLHISEKEGIKEIVKYLGEVLNEYEIKTGIELDGKFYELTQKYKEISAERYYSLYCKLEQFDNSKQERRMGNGK